MPDRAVYKAASKMLTVWWKLQKLGEAGSTDYLRKAASREQQQPKREAVGATTISSAIEAELPKLFGVHILPQIALNAAYGTTKIKVCLLDFGLALFPFLFSCLFVPFGMEVSVLCH